MNLNEAVGVILTEWNIQNKNELGKGRDKKAFELKTNSDYVVKKFDNDRGVENEVEFQKSYPDLCAKIIKVNYERGYLIQEKLDTKKFLDEVTRVINLLRKLGFYFGLGFDSLKFYFIGDDEIEVKEFYAAIEKLNDPFLNKLKLFFTELMSKYGYPRKFLDIHEGNLGLDKKGNIKLLDL